MTLETPATQILPCMEEGCTKSVENVPLGVQETVCNACLAAELRTRDNFDPRDWMADHR